MKFLRINDFCTDTEKQLMLYLDICDNIRTHIPFSHRFIYQRYFDKFHEYHAQHMLFLRRPKWQQNLIRVYHKFKGYL